MYKHLIYSQGQLVCDALFIIISQFFQKPPKTRGSLILLVEHNPEPEDITKPKNHPTLVSTLYILSQHTIHKVPRS